MTISKKRAKVLARRASLRKARKMNQMLEHFDRKNFAAANPTPKLRRIIRVRDRNMIQIALGVESYEVAKRLQLDVPGRRDEIIGKAMARPELAEKIERYRSGQ